MDILHGYGVTKSIPGKQKSMGSEAGWYSVITRQQRTHRQEWDEQKDGGRRNRGMKALQKE